MHLISNNDCSLHIKVIALWGMNQEWIEALGGVIELREAVPRSHRRECCVCLSGVFQCLMALLFPAWNKTDKFYDYGKTLTVCWWSISESLIRNRILSVPSYLSFLPASFLLFLSQFYSSIFLSPTLLSLSSFQSDSIKTLLFLLILIKPLERVYSPFVSSFLPVF